MAQTESPARPVRVLKKLGLSLLATLALCGIGEILLVLSGFEYPPLVSPILLPLPEGRVDGRCYRSPNVTPCSGMKRDPTLPAPASS